MKQQNASLSLYDAAIADTNAHFILKDGQKQTMKHSSTSCNYQIYRFKKNYLWWAAIGLPTKIKSKEN